MRKSQDESRSNGHQSQAKMYNMSAKNVQDATGALKSMANGQQNGLVQSRNQNPLAYNFNGQQPGTFNHFAVGSKGLVGTLGGLSGAGRQGHQSGQTMVQ